MKGLAVINKDAIIRAYANSLATEGKRLIDIAFSTANFNNRTYNLHDSYGSCVFFNGKEIPNTRRYVGRKATVGKTTPSGDLIFGRAEIDNFFDSYKTSYKGFELVTAVAIYYGRILETGDGLRRKYKVISGMDGALNALAAKLNANIKRINI